VAFSMVRPCLYMGNYTLSSSFGTVKNHGISQDTIDGAISAAQEYFSLPFETKMKVVFIT
jgi:isopenicillin N synthase-like dioxygenase